MGFRTFFKVCFFLFLLQGRAWAVLNARELAQLQMSIQKSDAEAAMSSQQLRQLLVKIQDGSVQITRASSFERFFGKVGAWQIRQMLSQEKGPGALNRVLESYLPRLIQVREAEEAEARRSKRFLPSSTLTGDDSEERAEQKELRRALDAVAAAPLMLALPKPPPPVCEAGFSVSRQILGPQSSGAQLGRAPQSPSAFTPEYLKSIRQSPHDWVLFVNQDQAFPRDPMGIKAWKEDLLRKAKGSGGGENWVHTMKGLRYSPPQSGGKSDFSRVDIKLWDRREETAQSVARFLNGKLSSTPPATVVRGDKGGYMVRIPRSALQIMPPSEIPPRPVPTAPILTEGRPRMPAARRPPRVQLMIPPSERIPEIQVDGVPVPQRDRVYPAYPSRTGPGFEAGNAARLRRH